MLTEILYNRPVLPDGSLFGLCLRAPEIAERAQAGQFLMLNCGGDTSLRRPISLADFDGERVRMIYSLRGKGTRLLSEMREGDSLDAIGPLGHGYTCYEGKKSLLVGGGLGIYPLLPLAKIYKGRAQALLGFRSAPLINFTDEFAACGTGCSVITDDGSSGRGGYVTELLREYLEGGGFDIVYVCGPRPMMAGAAKLARQFGVKCEVSMEERMACGIGACYGCVCRTLFKSNEGVEGESYKRVCKDGPVFDAEEIIW